MGIWIGGVSVLLDSTGKQELLLTPKEERRIVVPASSSSSSSSSSLSVIVLLVGPLKQEITFINRQINMFSNWWDENSALRQSISRREGRTIGGSCYSFSSIVKILICRCQNYMAISDIRIALRIGYHV